MSVPPDTEQIWMCSPAASATQRNPSTDSGAPVEPSARIRDRSQLSFGVSPALRQDWMNGADTPNTVTPCWSASFHSAPRSG